MEILKRLHAARKRSQWVGLLLLFGIFLFNAGCVQTPKRDFRNTAIPEPQDSIPISGGRYYVPDAAVRAAQDRLLPHAQQITVSAMKLCRNLNQDPGSCNHHFALVESNASWIKPFNGYIWVTTGLMMTVTDDKMLALLLAHEMGHVLAHATTFWWDGHIAADVSLQRPLFGGDPVLVYSDAAQMTLRDLNPRYSGFNERDALRYSQYLLHIAGYDIRESSERWMRHRRGGYLAPMHPFLGSDAFTLDRTRDEIFDQEKRGKPLVP